MCSSEHFWADLVSIINNPLILYVLCILVLVLSCVAIFPRSLIFLALSSSYLHPLCLLSTLTKGFVHPHSHSLNHLILINAFCVASAITSSVSYPPHPHTPSHDTSLQSQIIGLRKYYWLSKWNLFDFAITIVSVLDTTVLDITVPSIKGINPSIIRIVRLVRILRIVRAGRLVKVCMGA